MNATLTLNGLTKQIFSFTFFSKTSFLIYIFQLLWLENIPGRYGLKVHTVFQCPKVDVHLVQTIKHGSKDFTLKIQRTQKTIIWSLPTYCQLEISIIVRFYDEVVIITAVCTNFFLRLRIPCYFSASRVLDFGIVNRYS